MTEYEPPMILPLNVFMQGGGDVPYKSSTCTSGNGGAIPAPCFIGDCPPAGAPCGVGDAPTAQNCESGTEPSTYDDCIAGTAPATSNCCKEGSSPHQNHGGWCKNGLFPPGNSTCKSGNSGVEPITSYVIKNP